MRNILRLQMVVKPGGLGRAPSPAWASASLSAKWGHAAFLLCGSGPFPRTLEAAPQQMLAHPLFPGSHPPIEGEQLTTDDRTGPGGGWVALPISAVTLWVFNVHSPVIPSVLVPPHCSQVSAQCHLFTEVFPDPCVKHSLSHCPSCLNTCLVLEYFRLIEKLQRQ